MDQTQIIELRCAATRVFVRYLGPHATRVTHTLTGQAEPPPERPWFSDVIHSPDISQQDQVDLCPVVENGRLFLNDREGKSFLAEAEPAQVLEGHKAHIILKTEPGEAFYGWGEWFNAFQRKSGKFTLKAQESIAPTQKRQTYSTIPVFFSSRGYAFFLLNSYSSHWALKPEAGIIDIETDGPPADYLVITGQNPHEILAHYTEITGRPALLPRWAFGLWMTSYPQEEQSRVLEVTRRHRERQIPLDAVILDYHWEDRFHNFKWRKKLFRDPSKMIEDLRNIDVRLGLIFTPFINNKNQRLKKLALNFLAHNVPAGTEQDDETVPKLYAQANSKGYFAHPDASWWFGRGGMVDFTNPAAVQWWNELLYPLYRMGVCFFKNDDGEYLPEDATSYTGMDGKEYHNIYGFYYGKAIYEGLQAFDERRPLIYSRSVWAGSQRYPAMFLGDQKPTYEHIAGTVRAGLNMSLLGFAYWTADIFGLDGKTTPEMHMRYAQWALMSPVARYFTRPPVIDDTRNPWSHSPEVEANFKRHSELRYRLLPTLNNLAWEAHLHGLPIIRPMFLEYPEESKMWDVDDQVLLGDSLLIAPVIQPSATRRTIRFPAGGWYNFWTDEHQPGGEREVAAPFDTLPLYVKAGTILPLGPVISNIPDRHYFERLDLHIWPPFTSQLIFHDDDGRTQQYKNGAYSVTAINLQTTEKGLEMLVGAAMGYFPEQVGQRTVTLVFHHISQPEHIYVNGEENKFWQYSASSRRLTFVISCPTNRDTNVSIDLQQ